MSASNRRAYPNEVRLVTEVSLESVSGRLFLSSSNPGKQVLAKFAATKESLISFDRLDLAVSSSELAELLNNKIGRKFRISIEEI